MTTKTKIKTTKKPLRIGLVVPHIFMHRELLPRVIFSPGTLALDLCAGLQKLGAEVTLFSPGPVDTPVKNITADLSLFETELAGRGDSYIDLLKKHPFTFITLARQVQSELIAKAYAAANNGELDIVHIYTNEEDTALPFAKFCKRPVVFTHHDPFNFLVKYKNVFPKYKHLHWLAISDSQRRGMPPDAHWLRTIHHGIDPARFTAIAKPKSNYIAYLGRIIEPKGVHLAIAAVKKYNQTATQPLKLKIAGKHYAEHKKDTYWCTKILPELGETIEYAGHLKTDTERQDFLGNTKALIVPSTFDEPFGMVMIEALACGTPVIGLDSGAIPEVIKDKKTGFIVEKAFIETEEKPKINERVTVEKIAKAIAQAHTIDRHLCRQDFEARFTLQHMCRKHLEVYRQLII